MKKSTRYLLALVVCAGIFTLWVLCQMYVAKGTFIGVLFCGAMFGAWKAIVRGDAQNFDEEGILGNLEQEQKSERNRDVDEQ